MNRFELKYQIKRKDIEFTRICLSLVGKFEKQYHVLSTYFDDLQKTAFHSKLNGDYERKKIRIRSYSKSFDAENQLYLEKKMRTGQKISKKRIEIDPHFLQMALSGSVGHPWLIGLIPCLTVYYSREEFVFDWGRVTLDTDITFKWDGFDKKINHAILEIKTESPFDDRQFKWLHEISKEQSFSKYATGMAIKEGLHVE